MWGFARNLNKERVTKHFFKAKGLMRCYNARITLNKKLLNVVSNWLLKKSEIRHMFFFINFFDLFLNLTLLRSQKCNGCRWSRTGLFGKAWALAILIVTSIAMLAYHLYRNLFPKSLVTIPKEEMEKCNSKPNTTRR